MSRRPTLILGGPGCGKTTALLEVVEEAFSRGVEPDRIAFVAFTRKAAQEARERMAEKFGYEPDDIPYFRTLHSLAFSQLNINPSSILTDEALRSYAKAEGLELSEQFVDEFGMGIPQPMTMDEKALTAGSYSRICSIPIEDACVEFDLGIDFTKKVLSDYAEFKEDAFLYDFTDMIEQFVAKDTCPYFDLLIVDEAQDLSRLQWRMVDCLMENSRDVYFAGDDDQAIYQWAGADVTRFLNLDADRHVLPVSYRLKQNVFDACKSVISFVDQRYEKNWRPHAPGGEVDFTTKIDQLDLSEGTWFLLARSNKLVWLLANHVKAEGFPYWFQTKDGMKASNKVPSVRAVLIYENLKKGKKLPASDLSLCWDFISPKLRPDSAPVFDAETLHDLSSLCATGFDPSPSWLDALSVSGSMREYIRAMLVRGESLIDSPRITCSTMHGVKGGEADNVVVWQKLPTVPYNNLVNGDPQELRSLFTAMSRAKDRLIFLDTQSPISYKVERML